MVAFFEQQVYKWHRSAILSFIKHLQISFKKNFLNEIVPIVFLIIGKI